MSHAEGVLARVHSEGMLGDVFGSSRCNSGSQLDAALQQIAEQVRRGKGGCSPRECACVVGVWVGATEWRAVMGGGAGEHCIGAGEHCIAMGGVARRKEAVEGQAGAPVGQWQPLMKPELYALSCCEAAASYHY